MMMLSCRIIYMDIINIMVAKEFLVPQLFYEFLKQLYSYLKKNSPGKGLNRKNYFRN